MAEPLLLGILQKFPVSGFLAGRLRRCRIGQIFQCLQLGYTGVIVDGNARKHLRAI